MIMDKECYFSSFNCQELLIQLKRKNFSHHISAHKEKSLFCNEKRFSLRKKGRAGKRKIRNINVACKINFSHLNDKF